MPQYLSPGVYVEEVPSAIKPIAGVSTSTAAFIGIVPDSFPIPPSLPVSGEKAIADGTERVRLKNYPVSEAEGTYQIQVPGFVAIDRKMVNDHDKKESYARVSVAPAAADAISVTYFYWVTKTVANAKSKLGTDNKTLPLEFQAGDSKPAGTDAGTYRISIKKEQGAPQATAAKLKKSTGDNYSVQFDTAPILEDNDSVIVEYRLQATEPVGEGQKDGKTTFDLRNAGAVPEGATVSLNGSPHTLFMISSEGSQSRITITRNLPRGTEITVDYLVGGLMKGQLVPGGGQGTTLLKLSDYPVLTDPKSFQVWGGNKLVQNVEIIPKSGEAPSSLKFSDPPTGEVRADYTMFATFKPAPVGKPVLCTSFSEYKRNFGDFSLDRSHSFLTHAVYGFFNNGGTRCYVIRAKDTTPTEINAVFDALDRIDDISIVVAPGVVDDGAREAIVARCANKGDRFAIFDGSEKESEISRLTKIGADGGVMPKRTDVAAWYFPWVKVFDPVTKALNPAGDGTINVPPSGHIAGVYARVDAQRGVHKAPANEAVLGALGVAQPLSKAEQDSLNPKGVNCIRVINDSVLLWGARTVGGDLNTDLKYINVKRTLLFLKKSIYEGTQWVVFEPNSPALWQTITRNVTAFLTSVWRSGALFGNTPQEAFYVKCDAETNPQEAREGGQIITEIGVAIVRPAEFVIFRISQWAGPGQ
ncbi:MAG: uncharacterized protein V7641_3588 [Blastocatellia bacterium]